MKRVVSLYGRLRDSGHGDRLMLELPPAATVKHVLTAAACVLGAPTLTGCVVATEDSVLTSSSKIPDRGTLAILPPVCGG